GRGSGQSIISALRLRGNGQKNLYRKVTSDGIPTPVIDQNVVEAIREKIIDRQARIGRTAERLAHKLPLVLQRRRTSGTDSEGLSRPRNRELISGLARDGRRSPADIAASWSWRRRRPVDRIVAKIGRH